ncbi:hypothetical protein G6L81_07295 [Agrobacterium rhizogenes]|nr:hypothetical protein [Rhizobium rhizogenes]
MIRYKTITNAPMTMEGPLRKTPLTATQQAELEAQMRRLSIADLLHQREDLKARRRRIFQALLKMRAMAPMPMLIVPKGSTRPEEWTVMPPEETLEETKARNLLADLTVELRRVLLQLAKISQLTEMETARMVQREMSL